MNTWNEIKEVALRIRGVLLQCEVEPGRVEIVIKVPTSQEVHRLMTHLKYDTTPTEGMHSFEDPNRFQWAGLKLRIEAVAI